MSPRRSGGRRWRSKVSVLSQIGPSTRASVASIAAPSDASPSPSSGRPSEVSATIGWSRAVQRRADQLRHAGIEDDDALGLGPLADVEHARHEPARLRDEEPAGLDGQARRPPVRGQRVEQRPDLAAEVLGGRHGRPGRRPGTRRRRRTCRSPRVPRRSARETARPRRTASRQASTAPSCEPTWRWIPRARSGPSSGSPATAPVSSVSVMPNFEDPRPTARPAWVSGVTSGLRRNRTSRGGWLRLPSPARRGDRGQLRQLVGALDRDPAKRRAVGRRPDGGPQVRRRLADPLERDPVVRDAGRARRRPLAATRRRSRPGRRPRAARRSPARRWP